MAREPERVPQLVEVSGRHVGRIHAIPYGEHVLGRGREADVQLHHEDVSRRHARIEVTEDGVVLHDLGSKNGISVGGRRMTRPMRLVHGQTLSFGTLTLSVSHPASHVAQVLRDAGETTVTATNTEAIARRSSVRLLLPLLGVLVFGGMLIALLVSS